MEALPVFPANYAGMDGRTEQYLKRVAATDPPPVYSVCPERARAALVALQIESFVPGPPARVERRVLPVGPSGETAVHIVTPEDGPEGDASYRAWLRRLPKLCAGRGCARKRSDASEKDTVSADESGTRCRAMPAIVYVHGGGWETGSFETHERLVRELAAGVGATVVFVDYERTPEAAFPVALQQVVAVYRYLVERGAELGVDARRLAIAGDSAGGNLATVAAMVLRGAIELPTGDSKRGGSVSKRARPRCQALLYPVVDYRFDDASFSEFAGGPVLTYQAMAWFWALYAGTERVGSVDPALSPLRASDEQLRDSPPTLVVSCSNDVLRDAGEAYGARISEAGAEAATVRLAGTAHNAMLLNGLACTVPTRAGFAATIAFLRQYLFARDGDGSRRHHRHRHRHLSPRPDA